MKISIYFLSDPRSPRVIRYVGQTRFELALRLRRHVSDARAGNHLPRNKWIRSLLRIGLSPHITLLAFADRKRAADVLEEFHIKANWGNLLNVAQRACGVARHTASTRKKMSIAAKKKRLSQRHRNNISLGLKRQWADPEIHKRRCDGLTGRRFTLAVRKKLSAKAKGRVISESQRRDISAGLRAWYAANPQSAKTKSKRRASVRKAWESTSLRRAAVERMQRIWQIRRGGAP